MNIGILSDSHGIWSAIDNAVCRAKNMDMWLHCGDCVPDAEYLQTLVNVPVHYVAGNCDWLGPNTTYEKIVDVNGHKIFLTHGHNYGVRYTKEFIAEAAESQGADIVIFGHTHVVTQIFEKPLILNPGSVSRPRDEHRGSFMIMELNKNEKPKIKVVRM